MEESSHYIDSRKSAMTGLIEVLNDLGMSIIYIDRTFFVFSEFSPADSSINANYVTLVGKNITTDIENALQKGAYTKQMQQEMFQRIDVVKSRRREFSENTSWKKYLANV